MGTNDDFLKELFYSKPSQTIPYELLIDSNPRYRSAFLNKVFELARMAENRIAILTYVASKSRKVIGLYDILKDKQDRGVEVIIVVSGGTPETLSYNCPTIIHLYETLGIRNVHMTRHPIHYKIYVFDDVVILGSHNLTASSVAGRREASIVLYNKEIADAFMLLARDEYRYACKEWCIEDAIEYCRKKGKQYWKYE